jgi:serine/threonine protein kinase
MVINIGTLLKGRYKVEKCIGEGGFGITYSAIDTIHNPNIKVIIKEFCPRGQHDTKITEELRKWFGREAQFLRDLGNDYRRIPQRLDRFEENNNLYIVQEYIEGTELGHIIGTGTILSEERTISIIKSILGILKEVHDRNIIHRDIKPSNLILRAIDNNTKGDSEDQIVLIDFGIAIEAHDDLNPIARLRGIGTDGYMPPEQKGSNPTPTFASDIYAVGMIGLQAVTGRSAKDLDSLRLPDGKKNPDSLRLLDGTIDPAAKIDASIEFIRFLNKALVYDLNRRFANATDALVYLDNSHSPTAPTDLEDPVETHHPNNNVSKTSGDTLPVESKPEQLKSEQQPELEPEPQNSPNPPSGKNSKKPWLVAGVLVLLGLGAAVVSVGVVLKLTETKWEKLPKDDYGGQISRPSNWAVGNRDDSNWTLGTIVILYPPRTEKSTPCGDDVMIKISENPLKSTFSELKLGRIHKIETDYKTKVNDETTTETRLSNRLAYRLSYPLEDSICGTRRIIEVATLTDKGGIYSLTYGADLKRFESEKPTFEEIVSRFTLN